MNNTNPIFEAMSGLDENYAAESVKPRKKKMKKPLKIALIAVAAAGLAIIVGFLGTDGAKHTFSFGSKNSTQRGFYLNLTPQPLTVPDEFKPPSGEMFFHGDSYRPISEVFEQFGLTPLLSDNVTDTNESLTFTVTVPNSFQSHVTFRYVLHDNIIDEDVEIRATYYQNPTRTDISYHMGLFPGEPTEIITLKDGSKCMVSGSRAVFSYGGAEFTITFYYEFDDPNYYYYNYEKLSESEQKQFLAELVEAMPGIDTVKQVLVDLGVYDPADEAN